MTYFMTCPICKIFVLLAKLTVQHYTVQRDSGMDAGFGGFFLNSTAMSSTKPVIKDSAYGIHSVPSSAVPKLRSVNGLSYSCGIIIRPFSTSNIQHYFASLLRSGLKTSRILARITFCLLEGVVGEGVSSPIVVFRGRRGEDIPIYMSRSVLGYSSTMVCSFFNLSIIEIAQYVHVNEPMSGLIGDAYPCLHKGKRKFIFRQVHQPTVT